MRLLRRTRTSSSSLGLAPGSSSGLRVLTRTSTLPRLAPAAFRPQRTVAWQPSALMSVVCAVVSDFVVYIPKVAATMCCGHTADA